MAEKIWKEKFDSIWKREGDNFIQFLLDAGLEVNALNKHGTAMLSYAAECGNLKMIGSVVKKGADCNLPNSDGSKPFHIAAKYGHKDAVKFFLDDDEGTFAVDSSDDAGNTPLHYIAAKRDIEVAADSERYRELLRFLAVDRKADLNAVNRNGLTPLLLAAKNSNESTVGMLLKFGADVHFFDKNKWTLLHYSCKHGWLDVVKCLVRKGCDINAGTTRLRTPLLVAANHLQLGVVEYLIESGASVQDCDKNRWTVLHYACQNGWLGVVKSLVSKGCDLNAKLSCESTPLLTAAYFRLRGVIDFLIESGADVDCRNDNGFSLLHIACKFGWLDVVKSVVGRSLDLNARNGWHKTALQYAIDNWDLVIIKQLLKAGKNGAYLTFDDYITITEMPLLKEQILKNNELCAHAVLNRFNNSELPEMYRIPAVADRLPAIDKMKIASHTNAARDIARCVQLEIQTNGYCNVLIVCPIVLSSLCVRVLSKFYSSELM